jgi:hypothetical protein
MGNCSLQLFFPWYIMQTQRVVPVLQSVAQVRNWVVANVPLTDTLLGYDLFLKLGNDIAAGLPLDAATIAAGLPYPPEQVSTCLGQMAMAGLVELVRENDVTVVRPTPGFMHLVDTYSKIFDGLFIVRSRLRGKQLLLASSDPDLTAFAQQAYDHVFDMGWLYLHNFGSICFLMASLVQRIAASHGYAARIVSGHVEVTAPGVVYRLGSPGMAKPGQVDGHACVVIDERMVLDFGLGNVRKGYRRDFPWGVALDLKRDGARFASATVAPNETAIWLDDWQSPSTEAELACYAPIVDKLFPQYAERFLAR